jgi:hypothetical protein
MERPKAHIPGLLVMHLNIQEYGGFFSLFQPIFLVVKTKGLYRA